MNTGFLKKYLNTIWILVFIIFQVYWIHMNTQKNRTQMNTEYKYPMSGFINGQVVYITMTYTQYIFCSCSIIDLFLRYNTFLNKLCANVLPNWIRTCKYLALENVTSLWKKLEILPRHPRSAPCWKIPNPSMKQISSVRIDSCIYFAMALSANKIPRGTGMIVSTFRPHLGRVI